MSVDTYLKGKDTGAYTRLVEGDSEILVAPALVRWAEAIHLDARPSLFGRRFSVDVAHQHTAACRHT